MPSGFYFPCSLGLIKRSCSKRENVLLLGCGVVTWDEVVAVKNRQLELMSGKLQAILGVLFRFNERGRNEKKLGKLLW